MDLVHYLQCTDHLRIGWQLAQGALHTHCNINRAMDAGVAKGARDSSLLHVTTRNIQNTHILDQISSSSQALPMRGFKNSARAFFSLQKAGG